MTKLTWQIHFKAELTRGKRIHSNHKNESHLIICFSGHSYNLLLPSESPLQDLYIDRLGCH